MKVVHSWLKEYVGEALPDAARVEELLNFHAFEVDGVETVGEEEVIDVDVLPNRSSDCLCHRGIARELATILDTPLVVDPLSEPVDLPPTEAITISIEDSVACPRFTAAVLTNIEVTESPAWLQARLKALGQRSINNIVDATNYVMFAIGQPLHAYDADLFPRVDGVWRFAVRLAKPGETVALLAEGGKEEDRTIALQGTELLIVDGSSDTPVGLAGVKGGKYAEVHAGTKNIIIEAAHFNPTLTRKTARGLGIVIDASKRFENEPSRELPLYAQRDVIALITEIAGGQCEGVVDTYLVPQLPASVAITTKNVNALLGLELSTQEIIAIITRIGATISEVTEAGFVATAPWERSDLRIEEDYMEEVGRIHGLSNIASVVPAVTPLTEVNVRQYYSDKIRQALCTVGFSEVITTSFQKKGTLQLQNALASDKSYLRNSLQQNISSALDSNVPHTDLLGLLDVRVFEIGTVFTKTETGVEEHVSLALGARTKGNGYHLKDDAVVAAGQRAVEACLGIELAWQKGQGVVEMNLSNYLDVLPVPAAYEPLADRPVVTYQAVSAYPAIARDIALWVTSDVTAEMVAEVLLRAAGPLLVRHTLFDTFTKEERTSFAFRLVFLSHQRTLTDSEINGVMEAINVEVAKRGWEVR